MYEFDDFYQEALSAFYRAVNTYHSTKGVLLYTFVVVCIKRALSSFGRNVFNNKINDDIDISELEYCIEDTRENPIILESFKASRTIFKCSIFILY